jgi:hypothetical protein
LFFYIIKIIIDFNIREKIMKFVNFHRKHISLVAMLTFTILLCVWANQAPAAPRSEKGSAASMENAENESTSYIEREEAAPRAHKGKKIPWLIIGAVAVVGAAAVYFLVLKKTKYELAVTLATGCTGTPAATAKYKKGEVVNYSYSTQAGYGNLQVKRDGVAVATTGTVTMDKAHSLYVSATYGATVNITSNPSGAKIYDNNADTGKTTPASFGYSSAGPHTYLLRQCGYQDYTKTEAVVVGQTYNIDATMPQGILDNFLVKPTCWMPYTAADWTQSAGLYKCNTKVRSWQYGYYNTASPSSTYTVEVKMRRTLGFTTFWNSILLSDSMNMNSINGYRFDYTCTGYICVWRWRGFDMANSNGAQVGIKYPTWSSRVNQHLGAWNVMKIVRSGADYSFYLNGSVVASFHDDTFDPRICVLAFSCGDACSHAQTSMEYDYARLDLGAAAGLVPGERVTGVPVSIQNPMSHQ